MSMRRLDRPGHYLDMPIAKRPKTPAHLLIERRIYLARGQKVMVDSDLAELYGVETKALTRAVRRNRERFPSDFMFILTASEAESLRCQFGTSNTSRGGRRYLPMVFTEHGVAMLASVLNSDRAVKMSIQVIRAFVKLREILATYKDLNVRVARMEETQQRHDSVISVLDDEISDLKQLPPLPPKRRIGFQAIDLSGPRLLEGVVRRRIRADAKVR
jgi:phage regulator Rha-like protein